MVNLYAEEILKGNRTFLALKNYWKPLVYQLLVEKGREDLCAGWKPRK